MLKKLFAYLLRKHPNVAGEVFVESFLGIIPAKSVDKSALDFLARNKNVFEPWLIKLAYTLQKENITQAENAHKNEFYRGALFTIRLFYSLTNKDLPLAYTPTDKPKDEKNPQGDVDTFLEGMKGKANGQKEGVVPESQAGKV